MESEGGDGEAGVPSARAEMPILPRANSQGESGGRHEAEMVNTAGPGGPTHRECPNSVFG